MKHKGYIRSLSNIGTGALLLGSGQAVARLASLVLIAYLARKLSVRAFGELILAQTLGRYIIIGTDMGSRLIGARLIAKVPEGTPQILSNVQRKRAILSAASISLAVVYALEGPVLPFAREFLVLFSLSVFPYALSVDWVAWGVRRFLAMSSWQVTTAFLGLGATVLFLQSFHSHLLDWIAAANGLALLGGATTLWTWWRGYRPKVAARKLTPESREILQREARWGPVFLLGIAATFNVIFQCLDVLLLGGLSTAEQVAQYGAAYKIINVVLSSFWLFTTAAYPYLAQVHWTRRTVRLLALMLMGLATMGAAVAVGLRHFVSPLTVLLFGVKFGEAATLLHVLALAIPFDFIAAVCGTVLVSSGRNMTVTIGMFVGVAANLALNIAWIPRHGALGAAWATVISYTVLVCAIGVPSLLPASSYTGIGIDVTDAPPASAC